MLTPWRLYDGRDPLSDHPRPLSLRLHDMLSDLEFGGFGRTEWQDLILQKAWSTMVGASPGRSRVVACKRLGVRRVSRQQPVLLVSFCTPMTTIRTTIISSPGPNR
jgi:hypothetical protein